LDGRPWRRQVAALPPEVTLDTPLVGDGDGPLLPLPLSAAITAADGLPPTPLTRLDIDSGGGRGWGAGAPPSPEGSAAAAAAPRAPLGNDTLDGGGSDIPRSVANAPGGDVDEEWPFDGPPPPGAPLRRPPGASAWSVRARRLLAAAITLPVAVAAAAVWSRGLRLPPRSAAAAAAAAAVATAATAPTVLVSIDGFRADYLGRRLAAAADAPAGAADHPPYAAPTLRRLFADGAAATAGLLPVMPSKTFPNHWSLVTGRWPADHGVVGNTMYDPARGLWFHRTVTDGHWWRGEPVWQTVGRYARPSVAGGAAKGAAPRRRTASYFWPGSEVAASAPTTALPYNASVPSATRVAQVVEWVTAPAAADRYDFVTLYLSGVDTAGHAHGPDSAQVTAAIAAADASVAALLAGLGPAWATRVNVLVISDHGMATVRSVVDVDARLADARRGTGAADRLAPGDDPAAWQDVTVSPLLSFLPSGRRAAGNAADSGAATAVAERMADRLRDALGGAPAGVYTREETPSAWRLRRAARLPRVLAVADVGVAFVLRHRTLLPPGGGGANTTAAFAAAAGGVTLSASRSIDPTTSHLAGRGEHGYDSTAPEMRAMLVGAGPALVNGSRVHTARAVDVYHLLCAVARVPPADNDGHPAAARALVHPALSVPVGAAEATLAG